MSAKRTFLRTLTIIAVLGFGLLAPPLKSDEIYTYTGQHFTSFDDEGIGPIFDTTQHPYLILNFAGPLGANLNESAVSPLTFTIGVSSSSYVLTNSSPDLEETDFFLSTDSKGAISSSDIYVIQGEESLFFFLGLGGIDRVGLSDLHNRYAAFTSARGTWTESATVSPEPAPFFLCSLLLAWPLIRLLFSESRLDRSITAALRVRSAAFRYRVYAKRHPL